MYVYRDMYMYTCIYNYIYIYIYTNIYKYIEAYTQLCTSIIIITCTGSPAQAQGVPGCEGVRGPQGGLPTPGTGSPPPHWGESPEGGGTLYAYIYIFVYLCAYICIHRVPLRFSSVVFLFFSKQQKVYYILFLFDLRARLILALQ